MKTSISEQTILDYLVPDYCEALRHYGYEPSKETGYFFGLDNEDKKPVSYVEQKHADYDPKLAEELIQDALSYISRIVESASEVAKIEELKECHILLFQKRLTLWQAMIASAREGRIFTDSELRYYERGIQEAYDRLSAQEAAAGELVCAQAQNAYDSLQMKAYHLLFDDALIDDINRMVGDIVSQRAVLIVGDKGIAKTEAAKFVMSLYGSNPRVVSVKGDMMSDELIGKMKYDAIHNSLIFEEGILLSAMRCGEPILLDEINFGDQTIIARLQEILLRKAGDIVFIQENGEEKVEIKPGFAVFATANEASSRYRHREVLDPAIRDRFDIIVRNYPDFDGDIFEGNPQTLMRLALSAAVDERGEMSTYIDKDLLNSFVNLSYITEYLYATPAREATVKFSDDSMKSVVREDAQPLLTDCITPRVVYDTVSDCAGGNLPGRKLDNELITRLLRSLDQAGSTYNFDLAQQVAYMLNIDLELAKATQSTQDNK